MGLLPPPGLLTRRFECVLFSPGMLFVWKLLFAVCCVGVASLHDSPDVIHSTFASVRFGSWETFFPWPGVTLIFAFRNRILTIGPTFCQSLPKEVLWNIYCICSVVRAEHLSLQWILFDLNHCLLFVCIIALISHCSWWALSYFCKLSCHTDWENLNPNNVLQASR